MGNCTSIHRAIGILGEDRVTEAVKSQRFWQVKIGQDINEHVPYSEKTLKVFLDNHPLLEFGYPTAWHLVYCHGLGLLEQSADFFDRRKRLEIVGDKHWRAADRFEDRQYGYLLVNFCLMGDELSAIELFGLQKEMHGYGYGVLSLAAFSEIVLTNYLLTGEWGNEFFTRQAFDPKNLYLLGHGTYKSTWSAAPAPDGMGSRGGLAFYRYQEFS